MGPGQRPHPVQSDAAGLNRATDDGGYGVSSVVALHASDGDATERIEKCGATEG